VLSNTKRQLQKTEYNAWNAVFFVWRRSDI
jgi:hypothetical protein